jgi:hypothetical protein
MSIIIITSTTVCTRWVLWSIRWTEQLWCHSLDLVTHKTMTIWGCISSHTNCVVTSHDQPEDQTYSNRLQYCHLSMLDISHIHRVCELDRVVSLEYPFWIINGWVVSALRTCIKQYGYNPISLTIWIDHCLNWWLLHCKTGLKNRLVGCCSHSLHQTDREMCS